MAPGTERYGKSWKIRLDTLAEIQGVIPDGLLPAKYRAFISLSDVIAFCGSAAGIPICLAHACERVTPQWVIMNLSATEAASLVNDLISDCFAGDPDKASEGRGNTEEPPDPLVIEASATGN